LLKTSIGDFEACLCTKSTVLEIRPVYSNYLIINIKNGTSLNCNKIGERGGKLVIVLHAPLPFAMIYCKINRIDEK